LCASIEGLTSGLVQELYHLSHTPSLFTFIIFLIGSHFDVWAGLDHDSPIYASCIAGMTDMYHHTHCFIEWDRVMWTFCQGQHQTLILLISASWVARITGMGHDVLQEFIVSKCIFRIGLIRQIATRQIFDVTLVSTWPHQHISGRPRKLMLLRRLRFKKGSDKWCQRDSNNQDVMRTCIPLGILHFFLWVKGMGLNRRGRWPGNIFKRLSWLTYWKLKGVGRNRSSQLN
jgi:hypothetical protein